MRPSSVVIVSVLLAGCGTVSPMGRGRPGHFAQTMDSATSACLRSPACYTATGEDALLPWLARGAGAVRTTTAVLRLLSAVEMDGIATILENCAKQAHFQVNEQQFGPNKRPTREQCEEKVKNPWDQEVKRAIELGRLKHEVALRCAQEELEKLFPDNFSLEPRYGYDSKTNRTRLLSREQVEEWLQAGWLHLLVGTLVPDVVIHETGNPLKVQRVYDFKFPCHVSTSPTWDSYPSGHPYAALDQREIYRQALRTKDVRMVSPNLGVSP